MAINSIQECSKMLGMIRRRILHDQRARAQFSSSAAAGWLVGLYQYQVPLDQATAATDISGHNIQDDFKLQVL
jgi:hypothetical protein